MTRAAVLERITRLLAVTVARGATPAEADTARGLATALIVKHRIAAADFVTTTPPRTPPVLPDYCDPSSPRYNPSRMMTLYHRERAAGNPIDPALVAQVKVFLADHVDFVVRCADLDPAHSYAYRLDGDRIVVRPINLQANLRRVNEAMGNRPVEA